MNTTRALLRTSGLSDRYWPLAVQHASIFKNWLPCGALGDCSPFMMFVGYSPDLSHLLIFGSQLHTLLPPSGHERKLACLTQVGRICWTKGFWQHMCNSLRKTKCLFKEMFECTDEAQQHMSAVPDIELGDECFIDSFVV